MEKRDLKADLEAIREGATLFGDPNPGVNTQYELYEIAEHAIERAMKAEARAQKLLDVLGRVIPSYLVGRLELDLDSMPEATVVHGEWTTNSDYPDTVICSLCGWRESVWWADKGTNYCPNCGAKMEVK
jgi:Zn finger protein HypA/HybF involved in hydrogenase expression